ncbi:tRNA (adenosine(37)-N6)-threonylcarbamoyltransferase complex ATPase subunit type 1 TsaE [Flavobacteriaceae bacterium]|jgi:tRNA threonylcarbamoyladenosine biosynthesis protein TsaE|nr:tRNA (adenosine(37)-N6)-threonylcarbamoyltransferase complex ATPase subunit type 1 TsaE [Flavobacteriaceae bacterium]MDB2613088.1 tRNA (adenosine(37)-N6)-threonylcarbamoyltransferase complex ATPase subunit type 1 TsaE [Flavobacteriaceae bacterium]MDC3242494.1 tRNA (adenosine(37)-N6)-threonylcarbamoyltransferase complex ATPase subunit type 1 TsaE [Flavobacteriaceae bacterium]MDC3312901.1 tRNA (adenosine(37)-N6)-threonylcarbamoyltransferase complex ATPase subunit type 1 TsaE [Flavobacteriaceae |tara:strand:+ start:93 stop:515 length:423 start_codon:yes stop_codon:yes gene_type:complete
MKTTYELETIKEVAQLLLETVNSKTILFYGDMGVGKTTLIKALVSELGGGQVSSPTFSIVNEYAIKNGLVYHFDFYRINEIHEVYDIGIEDYLDSKQWIFIEWPEKIREILPLKSDISYIKLNKNGSRTLNIEPFEENID